MKKSLIFVGGKYTGDEVRCTRKAEEASVKLIRKGFAVIIPHKNTLGFEKYEDEVIGYDTWTEIYKTILERCDILYVLDNWKDSYGTKEEIRHAIKHGIPVVYEDGHMAMTKHCSDLKVVRCFYNIVILEKIAKESRT